MENSKLAAVREVLNRRHLRNLPRRREGAIPVHVDNLCQNESRMPSEVFETDKRKTAGLLPEDYPEFSQAVQSAVRRPLDEMKAYKDRLNNTPTDELDDLALSEVEGLIRHNRVVRSLDRLPRMYDQVADKIKAYQGEKP